MDEQPVLDIQNLRKYYPVSTGLLSRMIGEQRYIKAVDDVSLTLREEEVVGIIGESGSGKSTLVETVLRLEEPTGGSIRFKRADLTSASKTALRRHREDAQIIFQDPYDTLNPQKTVFQAIAEPLRNFRELEYDELRERTAEILHEVGLRPAEEYLDTYPSQLSGGQRQRVNIARSVVLDPSLLIADEPVSMLDVSLQAGIIKMLDRLKQTIGFSMLYVSHNLPVVRLVADRIGVMYRGRLVELGSADDIIENPKHPYTRALVASLPSITERRDRIELPEQQGKDHELPSGCRFRDRCPDAMAECANRTPDLETVADHDVACFLHHDHGTDTV
ncbi:ABC transporter ATP-binding protein [Halobellus marinus]|uniref:ABC transporter ATP-binding protein n=1 Tax=Halobellus TaxID=1073986 RepID=UPI0028AC01D5|nr:ABC transporter ATP-binding protein [Halobellus sp. DFY28]